MEQPLISETQKQSNVRHPFFVAGIAIAGLCMFTITAVSAYPYVVRPYREAAGVRALEATLPQVAFVHDTASTTTAYLLEGGNYVPEASGDLVVSRVRTSQGLATITRASDGLYKIVYKDRAVVYSHAALTGLDVSPDGTHLVYARQLESVTPTRIAGSIVQFLPLETNEWTIVLLDVEKNTSFELGTGVQPFFTDATHVIHISPVGVFVTNTATGEHTQLVSSLFPRVLLTSLVSPDHTHMGVVPFQSASMKLYRVSATAAEEIALITLPERSTSYLLGNTELYTLRTAAQGIEIWKQSFGVDAPASMVALLPGSLYISRIFNK